jgi:hypothetical protein
MWLLLAVGLGFTAVWVTGQGPTFGYVILGCYLGLVLATLIWNPVTGMNLTSERLVISPEQDPRTFPLAQIERLVIKDWSDSTDFRLHLTDGSTAKIEELHVPSIRETIRVFEAYGVPVTRS